MAQPISTPRPVPGQPQPARGIASAIVATAAGLGAVIGLGATALWLRYGTAVFFETIASGLAGCF